MLLETNNLCKSFGGMDVLCDISFTLKSGTITAIVGANGAGKTTLFNLLQGFLKQDSGTINYCGGRIEHLPPAKRARLGIGRLWQDVRLFGNLSVLENLLAATKNHPGDSLWRNIFRPLRIRDVEKMTKKTAEKLLALLDLEEDRHKLAKELSYGEQKLLALGRLLINEANLLLLDEPLSGISPLMIDKVLSFVQTLPTQGKTVLLIEHNIKKVLSVADRVIVMGAGRMEPERMPDEFFVRDYASEVLV